MVVFYVISLIAFFITVFSASLTMNFSDHMYDRRFGNCPIYSCPATTPKVAVVIAFLSSEVSTLIAFLSSIEVQTSTPRAGPALFELLLVLIDEPSPDRRTTATVRSYVNGSNLSRFFGSVRVVPPFANVPGANELLRHFVFHANLFESHCFFQYLSPRTRILRSDWLDGVAAFSINASSKNFWVKGGTDMAFRPFGCYEDVQISLYSIYAAHSACLKELVDLAEENHPTWPVARSITQMMRNPADVRLAHMLGTRIVPACISVGVGDTAIGVADLRRRFADAYWAEGTGIVG
jgi:hypothetical protein